MTERASVVDDEGLLPQLVAHLREHRTRLRQEWAGRIHEAHLLQAMTALQRRTISGLTTR